MTDVLIIGVGPSGSIAAALLVKQGFKVLVLEKQKFPRFSIGESLLAQSLALLENAGMLEAVQAAGFQYKNGAVVVRGEVANWQDDFAEPLMYGVDTFRAFVNTGYDGRLQDIFFFEKPDTKTRLYLCSVLVGYAWDRANPLTGEAPLRRLNAIARACKPKAVAA